MKKSGEAEHTLYELPQKTVSKYKLKKLQLFCLNLPLIIGIPFALEFWPTIFETFDWPAPEPQKAERAMALFATSDMLITASGYKNWSAMRKMVTKITYNHETDRLTFEQQFGTVLLGRSQIDFSPKEVEKIGKHLRTFWDQHSGYKSIIRGEQQKMLATEYSEAVWHDRKLFETIIS